MTPKLGNEWADATRNPVIGHTKIGPRRVNCHAARVAQPATRH